MIQICLQYLGDSRILASRPLLNPSFGEKNLVFPVMKKVIPDPLKTIMIIDPAICDLKKPEKLTARWFSPKNHPIVTQLKRKIVQRKTNLHLWLPS